MLPCLKALFTKLPRNGIKLSPFVIIKIQNTIIMKTIKIICFLTFSFVISITGYSQGRHGGGHRGGGYHGGGYRHGGKVVIRRSVYRPNKIVVFHPGWHAKHSFYRRWVYFPKYNFYWDNWRNHYMCWNGTIWVTQVAAPATVVNVDLATEKQYELKEADDDNDDIATANETHKTEYKPE